MPLFNEKDISRGVNIELAGDADSNAVVFLPHASSVLVNVFTEHKIFSPHSFRAVILKEHVVYVKESHLFFSK